MHVSVWFAWLFWRLFETYEAHSGYVFPWLHGYNTMYHDYHHTVNIGNFGGCFARSLWANVSAVNNALNVSL